MSPTDEAAKKSQSEADLSSLQERHNPAQVPRPLSSTDSAGEGEWVKKNKGRWWSLFLPHWCQAPTNYRNQSKWWDAFLKFSVLIARFIFNFSTVDVYTPASFLWQLRAQKSSSGSCLGSVFCPATASWQEKLRYFPSMTQKVIISHLGTNLILDSNQTLRWPRRLLMACHQNLHNGAIFTNWKIWVSNEMFLQ